jgi:hypothetical protein
MELVMVRMCSVYIYTHTVHAYIYIYIYIYNILAFSGLLVWQSRWQVTATRNLISIYIHDIYED